jgi:hypothetical protein
MFKIYYGLASRSKKHLFYKGSSEKSIAVRRRLAEENLSSIFEGVFLLFNWMVTKKSIGSPENDGVAQLAPYFLLHARKRKFTI